MKNLQSYSHRAVRCVKLSELGAILEHADHKVRCCRRWGRGKDMSTDFVYDEQVSSGIRAHSESLSGSVAAISLCVYRERMR